MENTSQLIPIFLNVIAAFVSAFGQYLYQIGAKRIGIDPIYKLWPIFGGIFLFTLVAILFLWSFKLGGRLSVTYPVYASTFIWGTLIGIYLSHEPWSWGQVLGTLIVILGIATIAVTSPS